MKTSKFILVFIMVSSVFLISCNKDTVKVKNDTPMDTAKSLIKAMIEQDTKVLARIVTETSLTDSPKEMELISRNLGMTKMKMSDFNFAKGDNEGVVLLSFNDKKGHPVVWKWYFRKNGSQDYYTFGQFYSGRVFMNDKPSDVMKAFFQGYIAGDKAFLSKLQTFDHRNNSSRYGDSMVENFSKKVPARIKDLSQVEVVKTENQTGGVLLELKIKSGDKVKKITMSIDSAEDGYIYGGVGGNITNNSIEYAVKYFFLVGVTRGDLDQLNYILTDHECQRASDIVQFAQNHGVVGMKPEQLFNHMGETENDQMVEFQDNQGKKVNWVLHFIKENDLYFIDDTNLVSMKKDYKPDVNEVSHGSPMEAAKTIIQGIIDQNPEPLARLMWMGMCNPAVQLTNSKNAKLIVGMPMEKIHFEQEQGKDIVTVNFQKNGKKVQWKLSFKKGQNDSSKYYLDATNIIDRPSRYLNTISE